MERQRHRSEGVSIFDTLITRETGAGHWMSWKGHHLTYCMLLLLVKRPITIYSHFTLPKMNTKFGLTQKDFNYLNCSAKSIAKLESYGVEELQIKRMLYELGVFVYRQANKAGLPTSMKHPLLSAPKKVWDNNEQKFVSEVNTEKELVTA
jgi:hypothetical protein